MYKNMVKLNCWSLKFIYRVLLVPKVLSEHYWSLKLQQCVLMVLLLTSVSFFIYASNVKVQLVCKTLMNV